MLAFRKPCSFSLQLMALIVVVWIDDDFHCTQKLSKTCDQEQWDTYSTLIKNLTSFEQKQALAVLAASLLPSRRTISDQTRASQ